MKQKWCVCWGCGLQDFEAEKFLKQKFKILVLATYGEGEPTDNAREFFSWVSSHFGWYNPVQTARVGVCSGSVHACAQASSENRGIHMLVYSSCRWFPQADVLTSS